jgi:hypothetical protein
MLIPRLTFQLECISDDCYDTLLLLLIEDYRMNIFLLTIGAVMFLTGYVWVGVDALRNDPSYGKWSFFSGLYRLNYCKANWNRTRIPFLGGILGLVLIVVGLLIPMS